MQWPGETLLGRMWETVTEKGIGGLFKPWQLKREGRAAIDVRRHELLAMAQAEKEAEAIKLGLKEYGTDGRIRALASDATDPPEPIQPLLVERHDYNPFESLKLEVSERMFAESVRCEANVSNALLSAAFELETDSSPPPIEKPNDDWLYRWRDAASEVSAEEIQDLWGRLLVGEIKAPGTYSLRTLDFLRNISKDEAGVIASLAPFVIADRLFRASTELLEEAGIGFEQLMQLQDLSILNAVESLNVNVTLGSIAKDSFNSVLVSRGRALVLTHVAPGKTLDLGIYAISRIGLEILSLVSSKPHEGNLRLIGLMIKEQGFDVELVDCLDISGDIIKYKRGEKL